MNYTTWHAVAKPILVIATSKAGTGFLDYLAVRQQPRVGVARP